MWLFIKQQVRCIGEILSKPFFLAIYQRVATVNLLCVQAEIDYHPQAQDKFHQ